MVVKAPDTRLKRRPKKEPVPDARERQERSQEIKVRLEKIGHEVLKHQEIRDRATEEKKNFIENLNSEEKRLQARVNDVLEQSYEEGGSVGKIMDAVLQKVPKEPSLESLKTNINKRTSQVKWHTEKLHSLATERDQLQKELKKLELIDSSYAVYDALKGLFTAYETAKSEYERVRTLAAKAEALHPEWFSKVDPPNQFYAVVASSYLSRSLGKSSLSAFVSNLQAISGPYQSMNPFHVEYADRDTAEIDAHVPLRRPNFNTPRSIVK
jgi:DNA repair exonuclease SbcCD ATPase subunit